MFSLYVHVPFCAQVCAYCDFPVLRGSERLHVRYVELVLRELEIRHNQALLGRVAQTVYLGGGTPTELSVSNLQVLLRGIDATGILAPNLLEYTVECNPETALPDRLDMLAKYGVGRWSLGVQSFRDDILTRIGRKGRALESRQAIRNLSQMPGRLSCDLMFDLPGQTVPDFLEDLEEVKASAGHVSFYGLAVEPRTLLGQQVSRGIVSVEDDAYADFYRQGVASLALDGVYRYEVSNFARIGEEGIHNRNYWERGEYLGVGPGAHSFYDGVRWSAPRAFARWAEWVEAGCPIAGMEQDPVLGESIAMEHVWLSLRQSVGLPLLSLWEYGISPAKLEKAIQPYIAQGWLVKSADQLRLSGDGWVFMDRVVRSILEQIF